MESITDIIKRDATLIFVEPHITGGESTVKISASVAIQYQNRKYYYSSAEEALADFIAVNWCTILPLRVLE